MTETGHGSDVQALKTTATYDPAPRSSSSTPPPDLAQGLHRRCRRNREDGSGFRATDHGRRRGPRRALLVVPIRDDEGNDLPGVTTWDCHYKGGLPGWTTAASSSTTSGCRARTC